MAKKPKQPPARWEEALQRLKVSKHVVYDAETSGLVWQKNHIVGHVLTFGPAPEDSYYVPVRHASGGNIASGTPIQTAEGWDGKVLDVEREIIKHLDRQGNNVVFHNGAFDLKFLWRLGMQKLDANFEDTQINAPLINEWQGKFSLAACAEVAGVQAKKGDAMAAYIRQQFPSEHIPVREEMGHYWRLCGDDAMAVEYGEGDGTTTWQLREWQAAQIAEQELTKVHNIESRLLPVLVRMSCHGIKVDEERLHRLIVSTQQDIDAKLADFPAKFNPRGPADVRAFCEATGHTDWPLTAKKQQPSFPESWLETHEPGRKIVSIRKQLTLLTTFLIPMVERHLHNGRVHPNFHQMRNDEFGTITGRLSCTDPNLQAASKRDKNIGRKHRSVFVADDGMTWTSADYNQCEPVLLAVYSRCKVLLDGYKSNPPVDAHQAVANATGLDRQTGKRINQTLITGGGKGVLVEKYGVPASEVNRIWREYFQAMPEIAKFQKKAESRMAARGYVLSLLGRRSRLRERRLAYQALNRLLQGGNADVVKLKMVEIDDYLKSEGRPMQVLNNVHDSLDFQHKREDQKHIAECLRIMTDFSEGQVIELDVPLKVDVGHGPDWAVATFGEE